VIPIPCPDNPKKSLEIQAEIVRILDAMTELTTELNNELTVRKKQYKHYRDQLLSFEDGEVEWKTVGEVFDLKNGYTPSKANADYWSNGEVPWFRMEDIRTNGRILRSAIQKVSASAVKGKLIPPNSLIMSTTATLGEHALIEVPFLTNQQITSFTLSKDYDKKVNVKFMFYYFFIFGKWCFENANKNGGMGIIGLSKLKEFKVPVPSLAEQARIVAILDKFDALTNSITEGLPREIELRQKQYAHYRDVLLSFPKSQEVMA
jgi:type I restriction enzyme S subunit